MKIAIEHAAVKRQIDGAFNLCGSRSDLDLIARQITLRLSDEAWSYGWLTIFPAPASVPNEPPIPWGAAPAREEIAAKLPCGTAASNVYEAYEAGKKACEGEAAKLRRAVQDITGMADQLFASSHQRERTDLVNRIMRRRAAVLSELPEMREGAPSNPPAPHQETKQWRDGVR